MKISVFISLYLASDTAAMCCHRYNLNVKMHVPQHWRFHKSTCHADADTHTSCPTWTDFETQYANLYMMIFPNSHSELVSFVPYVVRLWVSLFPLHKYQLGDDQGDDENQHHFCVHGLMTFVFGMHFCVLHSVDRNVNEQRRLTSNRMIGRFTPKQDMCSCWHMCW